MRVLQVGLFVLGVLAFLGSLAVAGGMVGEILWRGGIALMLTDLVIVNLWPAARAPRVT